MQHGCLVQERQIGHILRFFVFRRIHLGQLLLAELFRLHGHSFFTNFVLISLIFFFLHQFFSSLFYYYYYFFNNCSSSKEKKNQNFNRINYNYKERSNRETILIYIYISVSYIRSFYLVSSSRFGSDAPKIYRPAFRELTFQFIITNGGEHANNSISASVDGGEEKAQGLLNHYVIETRTAPWWWYFVRTPGARITAVSRAGQK